MAGLAPGRLLQPAAELCAELRGLLAETGFVVLRFQRPLDVAEMQGAISLFGEVKSGQARCQDGSMRQYLRYDHKGIAEHLRGTGIMEHRSGLVLTADQLEEMGVTGTGGTEARPFVYEGFHTDDSYTEEPAGITMLHARELPPSGGGDTMFIDMAAAFRRLDDERVESLRGLCAVHAYNNHDAFPPRPSAAGANDVLIQPRHPILRRQPLSGASAVYMDLDRATGEVDGMTWEDGQALLQGLQDEAEATAPRYSHRWAPHDVLVWDNIMVQHAASSDFKVGENRTMWRCLLEGETPQPY